MSGNKGKDLTFLPLGSIVRLKEGKVSLMIVGYTPIEPGTDNVLDYLAVMWPIGVMSSDRNLLFNRDQIEEVIFEGFSNDKEVEFRTKLEEAIEEIRAKESNG